MHWLHGNTNTAQQLVADSGEVADVLSPASVSAATPLLLRANLLSAFDGQATGVVNRMPGEKSADFHILSFLPGIDSSQETYAVWLLKDGLADVKRVAELSPRADGSWVADFTAGPLTGIGDPDAYRTLVIMKEKKGGSDGSRGTRMAEAAF
jgi:hypothetical protein